MKKVLFTDKGFPNAEGENLSKGIRHFINELCKEYVDKRNYDLEDVKNIIRSCVASELHKQKQQRNA